MINVGDKIVVDLNTGEVDEVGRITHIDMYTIRIQVKGKRLGSLICSHEKAEEYRENFLNPAMALVRKTVNNNHKGRL